MRNPLHVPRVPKDTASAIQASRPHARQATLAGTERLKLIAQLRVRNSRLSDQERAAAQNRIAELSAQARRENEAAERPYGELSARHQDRSEF